MGRSKIKIELIQDHKKRKSTLVNRKAGLVKKISELSILCDIKACMIIYEGNYNHKIWPNDSNDVQELINLYKKQSLDCRTKRGKTLSNFFENDEKKKGEIKVEKYPTWDLRFDYFSQKELQNLAVVVEKRMDKAKGKIELLKSMNVHIGSSSLSHQEVYNYSELMNNNNNLMNQTTPRHISYVNPFTDYNNFFQENIPISGVNSMGVGMDNGLLTIDDYQLNNVDHSTMIEKGNWLANNGIGSSSTMQPMMNNGTDSSSTMEYPFIYNGYTHMPYGFQ
ncbi:agamous-like MADS-box protein AGL103 [Solanum stenotomum]|uniref:agamous-like MADS-box protein AGL103 n=1 Tax=Solanum stenotomum TaxID=172797 RepID=UPI0020D0CE47|nr:agamous-like MADS-box protein AGL103 [Solanum stenotomum]